MKRPWQIWSLYGLCVAAVIPAMVWLTVTTLRLDRAREIDRQETELARRYAELQERINSALWRMDWILIPVVAQEAARPSYMYQSFYQASESKLQEAATQSPMGLRPSPILLQPSEFIKLHFQIDADNQFGSPQVPQGDQRTIANHDCGITTDTLTDNLKLIQGCESVFSYQQLAAVCSPASLPKVDLALADWQNERLNQQTALNYRDEEAPKMVDNDQYSPQTDKLRPSGSPQQQPISVEQRQRSDDRTIEEFGQRGKAMQAYAYGQLAQNQVAPSSIVTPLVRMGVMRSVWVGDRLILVRKVISGNQSIVQGCWLDWDKIRSVLTAEVDELLPELELLPIQPDQQLDSSVPRLATLPVQLVVDSPKLMANLAIKPLNTAVRQPISGLRLSLLLAWIGLAAGLLAIALLLGGVVRLSERKGAFVSAVTHELRTPLTTFRMYAEMLAEKMVPSEEQRLLYARTMKKEADRLGHLVENVLQFARLEHRSNRQWLAEITVHDLVERCEARLRERTQQDGWSLHLQVDAEANQAVLITVPSSVEQILFNLVENACKYARPCERPQVDLLVQRKARRVRFTVRDYGPGIVGQQRRRLFRAFCKSDQEAANTAQGVGLGLALCRRMAQDLGGKLWLSAETSGPGAAFVLQFKLQRVIPS